MDEKDQNQAAQNLIRRAVDGDARAMRQLVRDLTPVIRAGVGLALSRGHSPRRREKQQEVEDVTQSVLLSLFADRARVLLQWDPARGLDLRSFVTLLARRETASVLRSPRRSPWTEDPTLLEELDRNAQQRMGPESETISRDMLQALSAAMRARLSPRGAEVFDLMFLQGHPAEEVCEITGLSADAVYAWKSRIAKQLRELFVTFARAPSTIPPPVDYPGAKGPGRVPRPTPTATIAASAANTSTKRPTKRPEARPVTGAFPKITRAPQRTAREEKRTKTGPVAVVSRTQTLRSAGNPPPPPAPARRAASGSSTPPPPSER